MKLGFYSCMSGMPWGGSEELWWRAARRLQNQGHSIVVNYKWWPKMPYQLNKIIESGGSVHFRNQPLSPFAQRKKQIASWLAINGTASWLQETRPDCVLFTLGYHPDQVAVADECQRLGIPYAINVQCASSSCFISGDKLMNFRRWYQGATKVFFVSDENRSKLENNLACRLDNAELVANPFKVDHQASPDWPESDELLRLACVGRIHFQSKGQDLIVDVMKQSKWRERPIQITFYGHDQGNQRQLEELIQLHGLQDHLKLGGFRHRVEDIWSENHALLLPSRYEGAPLVVIEAMLCNRIAITTDIGRNRELMDDGQSGFIADGAVVRLVDDALERAWQKRAEWKSMGLLAGQHIRDRYPQDPIQEFADRLQGLAPLAVQGASASGGKSGED